ncbi:glycoside hydrolase family 88 protein [Bacillus haimaensis]|uniref:glycoside hydrolase family 88 protein n=1 Tax=Bacillus haimaensis TaxID=3160967 RepID=UPI003AA80578
MKGNYTNKNIQYWQEAAILLGLSEKMKNQEDKKIKKEILRFLARKFDNTGNWINKPEHIDVAILAYSVMKLSFIDVERYRLAFDYTWKLIKDHIGEDGTVGYRKSMMNYRYVDTIGFICPFLIAYGVRYKQEECINLALKQLDNYKNNGFLNNVSIPYHAYTIKKNVPQGLCGWGRGMGWYAIGLMDSWNELSEASLYKPVLEKNIIEFSKMIIKYQNENGSWNWTVTRKECRPDSSTTASLTWFLMNAEQIEAISSECKESSNNGIKYLIGVTRKNGEVDFSQGDTKDIGVYSTQFNILPFTQGFCLRVINLKNKKELYKGEIKRNIS